MPCHVRRLLPILLALWVFVPFEAADAGAPPVNQVHRDPVHKFSFKYFRDWKPVPLQPNEEHTVCRIRDPKNKGQLRNTIDPSIEVVRVRRSGEDEVVTGGSTPAPMRPSFGPDIKDAWDATIGIDLGLGFGRELPKKLPIPKDAFEAISSKDKPKLEGKLYSGEFSAAGYMGDIKLFVMLAVFEKDGVELAVYCKCGEPLRKDYERSFKNVAKSFKYFDAKADDVETIDALDGVNISARRRRDIERSMVKGWDVVVSPKQNYIVVYNTKNNKNHALAKEIADRIEKIREQIYEVQFPPAQPITSVSIVRVCADASEYYAYGGPGGSAGYWSSGTEELVFYDASPSKKIDDDTISVLYHEAFHQFIYYSVGDVAPHSWFNEGHGDYYAGAVYNNGKFKIKPFAWRQGTIRNAVTSGPRTFETVTDPEGGERKRWSGNGYTPMEQLVRFTQGEYYSYAGVCYAQGWSLIYFLREIVPNKKAWNAKWGQILDIYFDTLKAEVNKGGQLIPRGVAGGEGDDDEGDDDDDDDGDSDVGGDPEPGPGTDPEEPPDVDEETSGIPRTLFRGLGGREALEKAVEQAFKGVDWQEFEEAWLKSPAG